MTRWGIHIALGIALAGGLLFGLLPEADVRFSALFHDGARGRFPVAELAWAGITRDALQALPWLIAAPAAIALLVKLAWPSRKLMLSGRAIVLLLATFLIVPGLIANGVFKTHWNRPRPNETVQFGGTIPFVAWWDPRGECRENCSFFSGEAAAAFWTYAPAALTPPPLRPLAFAAATALGLGTGLMRVAFGRHFLSDVIAAGVVTYIVIWLMHGYLYRWPRTRWREDAVEQGLTRLAMPAHRTVRRALGLPAIGAGEGLATKDGPSGA
jgi:membrane-associated PAP2 superfamily phosphatase